MSSTNSSNNLLKGVINWLKKPYPFVAELKTKVLISFAFGIFIYLFLIIFQPFGIDKIIANKAYYLLGFGMITTLVMLFSYFALPLLFKKTFDLDRWVIGKEIGFVLFVIAQITLLNYFYNSGIGYGLSEQHALHYFVLFTVSVGFFPVVGLVFLTEFLLNTSHKKTASEISSRISKERSDVTASFSSMIKIVSESKSDAFEIDEINLIIIKSEDNYCKLFYQQNDGVKTQLLRITLKNIENQLAIFPAFVRSHRSFIVNKNHISEITGNARAYYIHFDKCEEIVPISRNFPKEQLL